MTTMGALQNFERRLEEMISGAFARVFRSAVQPVEIAAALQREADNNTQILSRDRRMVPNDFSVELSDTDLERLAPYDLEQELAKQLREHADFQGYVFPGKISVSFASADDLDTGRFRVRSRANAEAEGLDSKAPDEPERKAGVPIHRPTPPTQPQDAPRARRQRAHLEIDGSRHRLDPPKVVIGRGTEADIRVNDPGVSRRHLEILVDQQPGTQRLDLTVRDLGSTNGVTVDGNRVTRVALHDGSVVRIGNTSMTVRITDEAADV